MVPSIILAVSRWGAPRCAPHLEFWLATPCKVWMDWEIPTLNGNTLSKSRVSKNQPVSHHFTPLEYAAILRYPCWNPMVSESKSHSLRLDLKWATCFRWRLPVDWVLWDVKKRGFTRKNEIVCTAPLRIRFLSMDHLCDSLAMGWLACWRDCRSIYRTWCSHWNVAHHHGADSAGLREYGWQRLCHHGIGKKWPVPCGHHRGVCSRHLYHALRLRMHHAPAVHENCSSCSGSFHTLCYDSTHRDPGSEYWEPGFLQSCLFAFCTLGVWGKSVFAREREREREMFKKEQGHQIHSVKWSLQTCSHHGICRWFSPPLGFGPNKTNGKCQRCLENSFWQLDIDRFPSLELNWTRTQCMDGSQGWCLQQLWGPLAILGPFEFLGVLFAALFPTLCMKKHKKRGMAS